NHLLAKTVIAFLLRGVLALCFCHLTIPRLDLEAGFTRGFGQRLDAAMVTETGTVECYRLDTRCLGFLGNPFSNNDGCLNVATIFLAFGQFLADFGLERRSG